MIRVSFAYSDGHVTKVCAIGHSGYAESGGDIVCAAVSTLVQTAYLALKDIGCNARYVRDDKKALFEFFVGASAELRHDADTILRALEVGVNDLQSGYPQFIETKIEGGN